MHFAASHHGQRLPQPFLLNWVPFHLGWALNRIVTLVENAEGGAANFD
jgi:hypothetical protein